MLNLMLLLARNFISFPFSGRFHNNNILLNTKIQEGVKDFSRHFYAHSWPLAFLYSILPLTLPTEVTVLECCV